VYELGPPIFFGTLIVIVLNVPILTFERVEGRIFRPLALTVGLSILGALLLTLTLVPQLAALALRGPAARPSLAARAARGLDALLGGGYGWLLERALRW